MFIEWKSDELNLSFYGDLDALSILKIKDQVVDLIESYHPKVVKLHFKKVSFVDSSGIGFVLARYKQINAYGGKLMICDLSPLNRKIFAMSGIFKLVQEVRNGVKV